MAGTLWTKGQTPGIIEEFEPDALGNVQWKRTYIPGTGYEAQGPQYFLAGQIETIIQSRPSMSDPDTTFYFNSADGGVRNLHVRRRYNTVGSVSTRVATEIARYYYTADRKLAVFQKYDDRQGPVFSERRGVYEEYRYDALGRRVLLRSRADTLCNIDCVSAVERYVWDGDQLLHEMRAPGGNSNNPETEAGYGDQYGRITYVHAGGIDAPLGIIRDGSLIVPHTNWRGLYDSGTDANGQFMLPDDWPSKRVTVYYAVGPGDDGLNEWIGSLIKGMADQSGLYYRRNRYYDPNTGQFTQEDPIGLAGGLNLYGYANGDPVTYSDPFGLSAVCIPCALKEIGEGFAVSKAFGTDYSVADAALDAGIGLVGLGLLGDVIGLGKRFLRGRRLARVANKLTFGSHITDNLAKRGWSEDSVRDLVRKPSRTVSTRDTRHLPGGGRMNDPATAYIDESGHYVVINDRTNDVVQISNRNDPDWRAPWENK